MDSDIEIIDYLTLYEAMELEVQICRLPSGEKVIRFEDCTGKPPIIYGWAFDRAVDWIKSK